MHLNIQICLIKISDDGFGQRVQRALGYRICRTERDRSAIGERPNVEYSASVSGHHGWQNGLTAIGSSKQIHLNGTYPLPHVRAMKGLTRIDSRIIEEHIDPPAVIHDCSEGAINRIRIRHIRDYPTELIRADTHCGVPQRLLPMPQPNYSVICSYKGITKCPTQTSSSSSNDNNRSITMRIHRST